MTGTLTLKADPTASLQAATKQYVDNAFAANDAMIFKGTIGTGGTVTALPASHNAGWTYRVITAGTYAGKTCEIGDLIICITDSTTANDDHWTVAQTNLDGAVIGPASATDGAIALYDGTTGKLIKNSSYTTASFAASTHTHSFASLSSKPTTLSGYGITDAATSTHTHGNLTNDGKLGSTADYAVVTGTGGAITAKSIAVAEPTASGNTVTFIATLSQKADGQIVLTKKTIPNASTSTAGIIKIGTTANDAASGTHTHTTSLTQAGTSQINLSANTVYTLSAGGTSVVFKTPADGNTDTKVNVVARGTTKSYLMADTTAPTGTAAAHTAVAETGVYLSTTTGELNAVQFKVNEAVTLQYNSTTKSLDFIFV